MKADKGTPELQEKREALARLSALKRTGLIALYGQHTIDAEQYGAGLVFAASYGAAYRHFQPKSCLANLCHIPTQEATAASERWLALLGAGDAKNLHGRLTGKLARKSFYARGEKWHQIVEHVAGNGEWGVRQVCGACGVGSDTARAYIRRAFDALAECIAEIERENKKH